MVVRIGLRANIPALQARFSRLTKETRFHLPNVVLDECANYVVDCIRDTAPERTGALKQSVRIYAYPDQRVISVEAPYAFYVEEGTEESPGRYVPAIDKRLIHSERRVRKSVYELALTAGYSKEKAARALITPIRKSDGLFEQGKAGFYIPPTKRSKVGIVVIDSRLRGEKRAVVIAHELFHAVSVETATPTAQQRAKAEAAAEAIEKVAVSIIDIGMHPGIKATHFFEKAITKAAEHFDEIFSDAFERISTGAL